MHWFSLSNTISVGFSIANVAQDDDEVCRWSAPLRTQEALAYRNGATGSSSNKQWDMMIYDGYLAPGRPPKKRLDKYNLAKMQWRMTYVFCLVLL